MDRTVEIRTPESIAFAYELAGLGSRFLALAVDVFVQVVVAIALLYTLVYASTRLPKGAVAPSRFEESVATGIFLFAVFMLFFGYFIVFEAFWHGQTPGKRLLGIRVVRDGGYAVDLGASLVRNVIRIVEGSMCFYVVAAISALVSSENKRVGDFAAGTIVVRDARLASPAQLGSDAPSQYAATAILQGDERELVHRFIERREMLPPQRRAALASDLAARIRPRVSADLAALPDEALLERL